MIAHALITVLSIGLVYGLTCRATMMSRDTRRAVRWAFAFQATAAVGLAVVPWLRPDALPYCVALLLAATVVLQYVTSSLWPGTPPAQFQVRQAANDSKPAPLREISHEELQSMWRRGPRA